MINSQATICYVDMVSLFVDLPDRRAALVVKVIGTCTVSNQNIHSPCDIKLPPTARYTVPRK